jgi:Mg2+ and Co2+ transporter CorA
MLGNVTRGVLIGAGAGAAIGVVGHMMNQKDDQSLDVGIPVRHLHTNAKMREVICRFKRLATQSAKAIELYTHMVRSCDAILALANSKGGDQFRANRANVGAVAAARALTRQALRTTELHMAPMAEDVEELEGMLNNILHNMLLDE